MLILTGDINIDLLCPSDHLKKRHQGILDVFVLQRPLRPFYIKKTIASCSAIIRSFKRGENWVGVGAAKHLWIIIGLTETTFLYRITRKFRSGNVVAG